MKKNFWLIAIILILFGLIIVGCGKGAVKSKSPIEFLNVSYDPTRELYSEFNKNFGEYWKKKTLFTMF